MKRYSNIEESTYELVALANGEEYPVYETEYSEVMKIAYDAFMRDEMYDNVSDFDKSLLSDGGEIVIRKDGEEISREEVYSYDVVVDDCDYATDIRGYFMDKEKAIAFADEIANDTTYAEDYKVVVVSQNGDEIYSRDIKNA
jgi:hypothetical protein